MMIFLHKNFQPRGIRDIREGTIIGKNELHAEECVFLPSGDHHLPESLLDPFDKLGYDACEL